jgi:hypothetical protein
MPISLDQFLKVSEVADNSWWVDFEKRKLPVFIEGIDRCILEEARSHKPGTPIKVKILAIYNPDRLFDNLITEFVVKEIKKKDSPLRLRLEELYPDWHFTARWSQEYRYSGYEEPGELATLCTDVDITLIPKRSAE